MSEPRRATLFPLPLRPLLPLRNAFVELLPLVVDALQERTRRFGDRNAERGVPESSLYEFTLFFPGISSTSLPLPESIDAILAFRARR